MTIQKRRISWAEFYQLRPDLRPANDNAAPAAEREPQPQASATVRCATLAIPATKPRLDEAAWSRLIAPATPAA
jgi:hypothetical protein